MNRAVSKATRGSITAVGFILNEFKILVLPILFARWFLKFAVIAGVLGLYSEANDGFSNVNNSIRALLYIVVPLLILYYAPRLFHKFVDYLKEKSDYVES